MVKLPHVGHQSPIDGKTLDEVKTEIMARTIDHYDEIFRYLMQDGKYELPPLPPYPPTRDIEYSELDTEAYELIWRMTNTFYIKEILRNSDYEVKYELRKKNK